MNSFSLLSFFLLVTAELGVITKYYWDSFKNFPNYYCSKLIEQQKNCFESPFMKLFAQLATKCKIHDFPNSIRYLSNF